MARLSPITIGLSGLMLIFLGATIFLVVRPHHRSPPSDDADLSLLASPPVPPAPAPAPAIMPAPPPPPPPPPIPAPAPAAVVETAAESDAPPSAETPTAPTLGRRALLVVNHNRRLQEADEQVFVTLNLSETARAEIRRINEEYRKRTEVDPTQPGGGGNGGAGTAGANLARQDALRLFLGTVPAEQFEAAERGAVLRLRGKYRFEWGRQLRE